MSKINAIRIINLNYNNNAIKISDEIFDMNSKSTLMSLQNGGGKSVLVQMIMAPFVHKRYQNAKDRPFQSYFTTNKPTFVIVEWKLDGGTGYVMTGMMVRKNQEIAEDNSNELDMINFICEYKERCNQDIYHIPVVEKNSKDIILKGYNVCRQLFESYKRERTVPFFYYDMNNSSQSRQYFDKLMEYQINYKEWENIIKKVNLKESGLSDLFSDCRDEKGLVEKWFLDAVENKLNKDRNRMQEFQSIMEKYIIQYRDNQSKIQRRDAINLFNEESRVLQEEAESFARITNEKSEQESRIADFREQIITLQTSENENKKQLISDRDELCKEISHLIYEKLSSDYYEVDEEVSKHSGNKELIQIERDELERELDITRRTLNILDCAKHQNQVDEDYKEYLYERERLHACEEKEENLEPERENLGSQLKHYYNEAAEKLKNQISECEESINANNTELINEKNNSESLGEDSKKLATTIGEMKSDIKGYSEEESRYNSKYNEKISRNVLGVYEAGMLADKKAEYEKKLEELEKDHSVSNRELNGNKEHLKIINRNIQDAENDRICKREELSTQHKLLEEFKQELKERKKILRYFQIAEDKVFNIDEVIELSGNKLREINVVITTIQRDIENTSKEYEKLKQGKVLELSEEFKQMLTEYEITPVYGMEWLMKNQKTAAQNKEIVEKNPFLPYALIMTKQELAKLCDGQEYVYTSSPVPILIREQLEDILNVTAGPIKRISGINFYVWFNDNLLDEEKLLEMLRLKKQELDSLYERLHTKQEEYDLYNEKREKVRNQKVSLESYDNVISKIKEFDSTLAKLDNELDEKQSEKTACEKLIEDIENNIKALERNIYIQKEKINEYASLCNSYSLYQVNIEKLAFNKKEQNRIDGLIALSKEKIERLNHEIISKSNECQEFIKQLDINKLHQNKYQQYSDECHDYIEAWNVMQAESRYTAITSQVSLERQEVEELLNKATARYQKGVDALSSLKEKYTLSGEEWKDIDYNEKEELHQEAVLKDKNQKIKLKNHEIQEVDIKIAGLEATKNMMRKDLNTKCQMDNPLPKEEIRSIEFDEIIKEKQRSQKDMDSNLKKVQEQLNGYERLATALEEYSEFTCRHEVRWDCPLSELSVDELTKRRGILIIDYNDYKSQMDSKNRDIDKLLGKIARIDQFNDEFYQKPIEALMNLTNDASLLLKQLDTILQAFSNLMEKLLVDISFVEKEKAKVVELMEDYLKEVHSNLGKIDHNSTITIRDKSVKMLKIELLDWNENINIFQLKLQDYIDEVTRRGIETIEQNGNILEMLGMTITTKALYDAVIGIANVQIKLYKIEAMREYPITWAEVAKNSGGEGFLSAFVILSSLLCYMRRNESDLFVDRNEGKVLIMDNPFAQTNASHLLKPLMEIAKKTNTQLICLSGLGGESIYNRFDNIYVLNLVAANLRSGMQYLKADHIRGSEEETMIVSQIEVMEQMQLEF